MTMHVTQETIMPLVSAAMFAGMAAVTLLGAVLAAASHRLVRSVAGLALSFVGLAGLYYYLHNPFLALMQILIYVGAVCVTIMFALMLAESRDTPVSTRRTILVEGVSFLIAAALAVALIALIGRATWMPPRAEPDAGSLQDLGRALLSQYGFAFELISVVLLLAILGALVVARSGRRAKS